MSESKAPEAAAVGSMIIEPDTIGKVFTILPGGDYFALPEHRIIYETIVRKYLAGDSVDGLLIRDELERTGELERIGGLVYLQEILDNTPTAANAEYYAKAVRKHKRQRDIEQAVNDLTEIATEPTEPDEKIEEIQRIAYGLESETTQSETFSFKDHAARVEAESKEQKKLLKTRFKNIDKIIGGFGDGEIIVVAARPSMGKSALALDFTLNAALQGKAVVYFSLEMTHSGLIERALRQYDADELAIFDITINERADTPEKQIAFIRNRQRISKVDLVIVDYLQLMSTGRRAENRVQEITTISRELKLMAVREGIPIIALSQLNRAVEQRDKHRPRMSDLRESGSIEQDADIVMLLHREDYYKRNTDPTAEPDGATELIIAKNRRGPVGTAELVFLDELVKFTDKSYIKIL